jgi:hypothetical protein
MRSVKAGDKDFEEARKFSETTVLSAAQFNKLIMTIN